MDVKFIGADPMVIFSVKAQTQIETAVEYCKDEVSWLGFVKRDGPNYLVSEIFIPPQDVHSTTTEMKPEGLAALYLDLIEKGYDTNDLCYHGHSHVNMGVGPSAQDNTEFEGFDDQLPFFVRTLHNKKGEVRADVIDREKGIKISDLNVRIYYAQNDEVIEKVKDAIDANVEKIPLGIGGYAKHYGHQGTYHQTWEQRGWERDPVTGQYSWVGNTKKGKKKEIVSTTDALGDDGYTFIAEEDDLSFLRFLVKARQGALRIVHSLTGLKEDEEVVGTLDDPFDGRMRYAYTSEHGDYVVVDSHNEAPLGYWFDRMVQDLELKEYDGLL